MSTPAFSTPVPLARGLTPPRAVCTRRNAPTLSVSTPRPERTGGPDAPERPMRTGRRVPTYRKLQARHRSGPAVFRQAKEARDAAAAAAAVAAEVNSREEPRRPRHREDGTPLSELVVGQRMPGIIRNTVPHGVYVDVGATRDGLVHIRDMAIDFVHDADDLVRSGDRVNVWVKYVDAVSNVLGLTMLRPAKGFEERTPVKDITVGQRYHGVVQRVTNYGAYVDIGAERTGFVHVTALWGERTRYTLDDLRIGTELWVHVQEVDVLASFITLRARARGGGKLDKTAELEEVTAPPTRGWLQDDESAEPAVVDPSTELAVLRPGEELVKEDQDEIAAHDEGEDEDEELSVEMTDDGDEEEDTEDDDDSESLDDDDDEEDEFAFAQEDEMMNSKFVKFGEVARMFDEDTEFVGFNDEEIASVDDEQVKSFDEDLAGLRALFDEQIGLDKDDDTLEG